MRKTVKYEDLIRTARQEARTCKEYEAYGKFELADMVRYRIDGIIGAISINFIQDGEDWDAQWDKIHNDIWSGLE